MAQPTPGSPLLSRPSRTGSSHLSSSSSCDEDDDPPTGGVEGGVEVYDDSVEVRLLEALDAQAGLLSRRSPAAAVDGRDDGAGGPGGEGEAPPIESRHAYPCPDARSLLPPAPPPRWPQRPVLLRPAPEARIRIRGVRRSSSVVYTSLPGTGYCEGCTLPVNTGRERGGGCLVIDFETDLFVGTAMVRIRGATAAFGGEDEEDGDDDGGGGDGHYFEGRRRTFTATVRGRFTRPDIPMSRCVTGQVFRRPAGKLPPRFIVKSAVKLISHLAPQLQADFDGVRPRFLSPLVSTAQTVIAERAETGMEGGAASHPAVTNDGDGEDEDEDEDRRRKYRLYGGADASIEDALEEPDPADPTSMHRCLRLAHGKPPPKPKGGGRVKARKRAFDRLYSQKAETPRFDVGTVYTFEFFQHLLVFDTFSVDLGRAGGKHALAGALDGQPLKFMAAYQPRAHDGGGEGGGGADLRWLWNFDIWHESLYEAAVSAEGGG